MLERVYNPHFVQGTLTFGTSTLVTLEHPDLGNRPRVSCIPEGVYSIRLVNSPKFGLVPAVRDGRDFTKHVNGREHILIHSGNTVADTLGCILVGMRFSLVGPYLFESKAALFTLVKALGTVEHKLCIKKA